MGYKIQNRLVNIRKKKQIHRSREQTRDYQWEKGRWRGNTGIGIKRYKLFYI